MNLILQGKVVRQARHLQKSGAMEKDAIGLTTLALAAGALALLSGGAKAWGGPAFGWGKRKIFGRSDKAQARLDALRSKQRGYQTVNNLPYTLGGAGIGATLGGLAGGGWGTALGALGGGYVGHRWGKDLMDQARQWWSSQSNRTSSS